MPLAGKVIRKMLEPCKNLTFAENAVTIHAAVKDENIEQIKALAAELK